MPVNIEFDSDNIRWAQEKLENNICESNTGSYLCDLIAKIDRKAAHTDEVDRFLRLVPDLFALNYESGYNPLTGEADDICVWDILNTSQNYDYRSLATIDKIEVVCRFSDFAGEVRMFLLGRTEHNTHPWLVWI